MKKLFLLLVICIANAGLAQTAFDRWPAMNEFHDILSQTYHPAEKGNLEPIKSRSLELAQKAEALNTGEKPDAFKTREIVIATELLQIKSRELHKKIKQGISDAEITTLLNSIHDTFHEIVGLCAKEK
ncbi:hypothetical protein HYN48_08655 [Flavobacterium magnum]|uniref:Uncharacterized protein n=1 Tax=Flavobacterium magnum TaxID=2162713 RepID=A0A2S0RES6_9FLAO|nr:hypothetical protein [Flavobacterium magnum]AWA30144.1 hypothetical protein HYN48_08655 [Flavobacterium magnum]